MMDQTWFVIHTISIYDLLSHPSYLNDNLVRCVLLLGLIEDVDRPPGLVGNVGNVKALGLLLANLLNLLKVLFRQLNLLEVLLDARRSHRLGDDGVATDLGPGEDDLCGGGADAAGDFLDGVVLDEEGEAKHVVSERLRGVLLVGE